MNTSNPQDPFAWWDAWILLAVIYATRTFQVTSLTTIIAMGDAINHAILTRGELETGLGRLLDSGMLVRNEHGFLLGERVRQFWAPLEEKGGSVSKELEAVTSFLGAPRAEGGPLPDPSTERIVTKEQYEAAASRYQPRTRRPRRGPQPQHDG